VRIGSGRSEEEKAKTAKCFFDVLTEHLSVIYDSQGLAISFELTELPTHKFNQNNLRDYLTKP
jgi:5-carboxymethyl-2-hydroxymuconate isomerase